MFLVYIIYSKTSDKYYVGFTSDLVERIRKHNTNHAGFTGKLNDWEIKYSEEFEDKKSAVSREKEIKSWKSKVRIIELIGKIKSV